ncbi:hypothetical protein Tco_0212483 [Tanacetum coccineum]
MLLEEADLEHGLEYDVSLSYRENPGEFFVPFLTLLILKYMLSLTQVREGIRDKNSETEEEDVKEDESDHNKERYTFEDDDDDSEFDDLD